MRWYKRVTAASLLSYFFAVFHLCNLQEPPGPRWPLSLHQRDYLLRTWPAGSRSAQWTPNLTADQQHDVWPEGESDHYRLQNKLFNIWYQVTKHWHLSSALTQVESLSQPLSVMYYTLSLAVSQNSENCSYIHKSGLKSQYEKRSREHNGQSIFSFPPNEAQNVTEFPEWMCISIHYCCVNIADGTHWD